MTNYKANSKTRNQATKAAFPWPKKAKHIKAPLFNTDVYLLPDFETYSQAVQSLSGGKKQADKAKYLAGVSCRMKHEDTGIAVFLLGVFDDKITTMVHELGHIVFMILGHVGVDIEKAGNNETFCYLQEDLYEQLIKLYKGK